MNRVAIVVQRCHQSVVGGSESLAWQYATLLSEIYHVDVLTTTAIDISDWANALPEGVERVDGVNIHRFRVTEGRTAAWVTLLGRLLRDYEELEVGRGSAPEDKRHLPWSLALQEEFIRKQGPYSEPLLKYLRHQWSEYKAIIFVTYLYPTSYFGLLQIPKYYGLIAPTLHDEPTAHLSAFRHAAQRARSIVWLTDAERRAGQHLWGDLPGRVIAMSVETGLRKPAELPSPYLLYCGRIDPNKGSRELFEYFAEFKKAFPSDLRLLLTGKDDMPVPSHPDIEFLGFVSEEEKLGLMAGAKVFVIPSPNESFSIVTLEAMAQRTPVLASSKSEVLVDHIKSSGAGRVYEDYESFAAALQELLSDEKRVELGNRGREYAVSRYRPEHVRESLKAAVESCVEVVTDETRLLETASI
jgi:glycosyltransferase involved in cell wall biosynthesis